MSTTKLAAAILFATVVSATTANAQYIGRMPSYLDPLDTPVDGDFVGRYDATIHFSGAISAGNKTVHIQVRNPDGTWSDVTWTRSASLPILPGQYRWSVDEALNLNEWEIIEPYGWGIFGETTVRAVTYTYLYRNYRITNVLGEATIYSYSNST